VFDHCNLLVYCDVHLWGNKHSISSNLTLRSVWRYQTGNHNSQIEEEQKTQRIKEIGQKDKQRSTKHTHQTKDWVTRTYLILGKISVRIPA
jgi:hypothetical protein